MADDGVCPTAGEIHLQYFKIAKNYLLPCRQEIAFHIILNTELRIHAVFPEDVLNILNINISGQNVLLDRQGSGDTGGLSHVDADGHNTEIGMSHMCAGDIAASQQQTVNRFGN